MQQGSRPTVAVNGDPSVVTGTLPTNNDSTIARQADRSGYPRIAVLTFPAKVLRVGENTITFTHGSARPGGSGPGWDTILLEVDEDTPPGGRAKLTATVRRHRRLGRRVTVTNSGDREARDVRITAVTGRANHHRDATIGVVGRDPNLFPAPIVESLAPGESASADLSFSSWRAVVVTVSADGGRMRTYATG
jgi:rhamnogalacturonan endolyase